MTTFFADLGFDTFRFRGDFAQASSPLQIEGEEGDFSTTPYQVADARHNEYRALRLLLEYAGREYYAQPEDDRDSDEILDEILDGVAVERESAEPDQEARLQRAAAHIAATDIGDDQWAYYAEETGRYYVVSASDLEDLCDYLDDEDPQISGDAYSHWCAGTDAQEQAPGWEPGDDADDDDEPVNTYSISIKPNDCTVSDERGSVPGIAVSVTLPDGRVVEGNVIPPEGDSIDCWAELQLCKAVPHDLLLRLGDAASSPEAAEYVWQSDEAPVYAY